MSTKVSTTQSIQVNLTKTISDYMQLCLEYDMSFYYDTQRTVMYIDYLSLQQEEYAQVFFNSKTGEMEQAYLSLDEDIHEYGPEDPFFNTLELLRKDFLKHVYCTYVLIEHPYTRMKRRSAYAELLELIQFTCNMNCVIEYFANIIRITTAENDRPVSQISIAINKGIYQLGMLRKQGITINIPTIQSMKSILEKLAS